jgi:hypothetical protein
VRLRHTGDIRQKVLDADGDVLRAITAYAASKASEQVQGFKRAQAKILGKDREEVVTVLNTRLKLPKGTLDAAFTVAEQTPRYGDPKSVWGMVSGLTEVSQRGEYMDQRASVDRAAGELLGYVL